MHAVLILTHLLIVWMPFLSCFTMGLVACSIWAAYPSEVHPTVWQDIRYFKLSALTTLIALFMVTVIDINGHSLTLLLPILSGIFIPMSFVLSTRLLGDWARHSQLTRPNKHPKRHIRHQEGPPLNQRRSPNYRHAQVWIPKV